MAGAVITMKGISPALAPQIANVLRAFLRGYAQTVDVIDDTNENAVTVLADIGEKLVPNFPERLLFLRALQRTGWQVEMT